MTGRKRGKLQTIETAGDLVLNTHIELKSQKRYFPLDFFLAYYYKESFMKKISKEAYKT